MKKKATILVVDDVPSNIQILAGYLKDDYRIKVATDGKRCLELVQGEDTIDLILLDVMMPEMDGYQVIKQLKENPKTEDIPVIFVTSKDEDHEEEKGLTLGAVDYIAKPIHAPIVKARIKTHVSLKRSRDLLKRMAMHDYLTGLYNRHYLVEAASQKLSLACRHEFPISILLIDIDHFKSINDKFGHAVGDEVLKSVSKLMKKTCRGEDIVARIGGEEFVMVLDQCNVDNAEVKAEELRKQIEILESNKIRVTVSIGVAALSNFSDKKVNFDDLLNQADKALYTAKNKGRNRVVKSAQ